MTERDDISTIADPRAFVCPACNARAGQPCTAPTVAGRREVAWVHSSRKDLAEGWD